MISRTSVARATAAGEMTVTGMSRMAFTGFPSPGAVWRAHGQQSWQPGAVGGFWRIPEWPGVAAGRRMLPS
jgi:hypothetical protein